MTIRAAINDIRDFCIGLSEEVSNISLGMSIKALEYCDRMGVSFGDEEPETKSGWRVIEKKLEGAIYEVNNVPDDGQEVLVSLRDGTVATDIYSGDFSDFEYCDIIDEVEAWMPFPEHYKGGIENDKCGKV